MKNERLVNALENNIYVITNFIESMTNEEIRKRRNKEYWTIYEHIVHLVETQIMLLKRLELIIKENHPTIVPFVPEEKPKTNETDIKDVKELLEHFSNWRKKQIEIIKKADGSIWGKIATHPQYNKYTFEILVRHILLHDSFHMCRIEDLWLLKDEYLHELK